MRYMVMVIAFVLAGTIRSENLYVRPTGSGAGNGSDWNNAFNGFGDVTWGSGAGQVGAGDVLYVAGGNYSGNLSPQASGTGTADAQRIIIRRATAADHGTDTGWNNNLDGQVKMSGYIAITGRSYITVDGVTEYDIYTASPSPYGMDINNCRYITLQYIRVDGSVNRDNYIGLKIWTQSSYILVRHCWISNTPNDNMRFLQSSDCTIEYCRIGPKIAPCDTCYDWHADMGEIRDTRNFTYRYNVHHWEADGLFFFTEDADWYIYGNVWHNGGKAMRTHSTNNAAGPIYVYNNSFYMCYSAVSFGSEATGDFKNNIVYGKSAGSFGQMTRDYNYYFVPPQPYEPHMVRGVDPFVNAVNLDFHITSDALARDAGTALDAKYAIDPDGNTRGADGKWDMGAFEFTQTEISLPIADLRFANSPALPRLIYNYQLLSLSGANGHLYNLQGQLVTGQPKAGIYLVQLVDGGALQKVTLVK